MICGLVVFALVSLPLVKSDDLIDEFNDHSMGIGFSIIPLNVWQNPAHGHGNSGMDAAGFYPLSENDQYHATDQQAVSVVTSKFDMNPYDGGYGTYGLAFHITEKAEFWKYFQVSGHGDPVLVAGPGDGANHIPGTSDWRKTLSATGRTYDWFTAQKKSVLDRYNTVYHNHDYNEFDTNGLSPDGLAGVFLNEQWTMKNPPSERDMCNFLKHANPSKSTWPVYGYKWYKLYIKQYLTCGDVVSTPTSTSTGITLQIDLNVTVGDNAQCKAQAQNVEDGQLCDDFFNQSVGMAFSMVTEKVWANPGGAAPGVNAMDKAVFFPDAQSAYQGNAQQAMTLVHSGLHMAPYLGAGPYGLALRIGPNSNFWKYFQQNSGGEICGQPHDGFKCGALPAWRLPVTNRNYDWFETEKNKVLAGFTGGYNEFDVNGLSSDDFAGALYWRSSGAPDAAMKKSMCVLLHYVNPSKGTWPIYSYYYNDLVLEEYVKCDGQVQPTPAPTIIV